MTNQSQSSPDFKVRVFANALGFTEDPVTGSASSFAAKYWATKANIPSGQEFAVKQVSSRSGDLGVVWEEETASAKLRGETRVASRGEIYL
jgi:predicted PhzF superfamily epimerase YddE/YHI9